MRSVIITEEEINMIADMFIGSDLIQRNTFHLKIANYKLEKAHQ